MAGSGNNSNMPPLTDRRWQDIRAHIRTTDEISFRLLGLVPLVSIAGIAVTLLKGEPKFSALLVLLSLFAGGITTMLWIWERRNIQTCLWLIARAAELEREVLGTSKAGQFFAFPVAPDGKGKRYAETAVYGLTIAAWLLLPGAVLVSTPLSARDWYACASAGAYVLGALWLGYFAVRALAAPIKIAPQFAPQFPD